MNALMVSEYRKLATLRSTWWALFLAPIIAAVAAGVGVHFAPATDHLVVTQAARGVAEPLWLVVTVIAILAGAGEFQHRTILTTLLASPRRTTVLVAKAGVIAGYGAMLTALGMGAAVMSSVTTANLEGVAIGAGGPEAWRGLVGGILVGCPVRHARQRARHDHAQHRPRPDHPPALALRLRGHPPRDHSTTHGLGMDTQRCGQSHRSPRRANPQRTSRRSAPVRLRRARRSGCRLDVPSPRPCLTSGRPTVFTCDQHFTPPKGERHDSDPQPGRREEASHRLRHRPRPQRHPRCCPGRPPEQRRRFAAAHPGHRRRDRAPHTRVADGWIRSRGSCGRPDRTHLLRHRPPDRRSRGRDRGGGERHPRLGYGLLRAGVSVRATGS